MSKSVKNRFMALSMALIAFLLLLAIFSSCQSQGTEVSYTEFYSRIEDNEARDIRISDTEITFYDSTGRKRTVSRVAGDNVIDRLYEYGQDYKIVRGNNVGGFYLVGGLIALGGAYFVIRNKDEIKKTYRKKYINLGKSSQEVANELPSLKIDAKEDGEPILSSFTRGDLYKEMQKTPQPQAEDDDKISKMASNRKKKNTKSSAKANASKKKQESGDEDEFYRGPDENPYDEEMEAISDAVSDELIRQRETEEESATEENTSGSKFKNKSATGRAGSKRIARRSSPDSGVQIDSQTTIYSQVHSRDVTKWEENN